MTPCLDALLAAPHVFIDDHVAPRRRIGRTPKPTDAELLCLAVTQVLPGFPSARHWIRFAHARLGHLFRSLPQQSAYNKRLNAAGPLISRVIEALARQVPTRHEDLRLIDSTPLPCAPSRETVASGSRPSSTPSKTSSARNSAEAGHRPECPHGPRRPGRDEFDTEPSLR
ncbi:hypothetical protein SCANM63S_05703 [Streptomyces canarius]